MIAYLQTCIRAVVVMATLVAVGWYCLSHMPDYKPTFSQAQLSMPMVVPGQSIGGTNSTVCLPRMHCDASPALADSLASQLWIECNRQPEMISASEAKDASQVEVIGLKVGEQHFAFAKQGMVNPFYSAVSFLCGEQQVAVTYSCFTDRVRVFTPAELGVRLAFGIAGITRAHDYIMIIDDVCYRHDAANLPVDELEFEVTNLADWRQQHPDTLYYPGGLQIAYSG